MIRLFRGSNPQAKDNCIFYTVIPYEKRAPQGPFEDYGAGFGVSVITVRGAGGVSSLPQA